MKKHLPFLILVAAAAIYALSVPGHLAAWDAIQFALGIERFDMPVHQPHPPGYLGHMAVAWALSLAGLASDTAVQVASIVETALAASAVFFLGRRLWTEREGLFAALLFAANPVVWFYAVSGETYGMEALAATVVVLAGMGLDRGSPPRRVLLFFLLLGLSGGVRQNLPLFLAPFAAWRLIVAGRPWVSRAGLALVGGILGLLVWLVPLAWLAGGIDSLLALFGSQFFEVFGSAYSPLMGAGSAAILHNLDGMWRFTLGALSAGGTAGLVLLAAGRRPCKATTSGKYWIFTLWLAPPLLWFVLMYVVKAGHLLVLVPAVALLAARGFSVALERAPAMLRRVVPAAAIAAQAGLFLAPPEWWTATISDCSLPGIQHAEADTTATIEGIRGLAAGDPTSVIVATRDARFSFRKAMYYLPDMRVLWLVDSDSTGIPLAGVDVCEAREHRVECLSGPGFWLRRDLLLEARVGIDPGVRAIAWFAEPAAGFASELQKTTTPRSIKVGPVSELTVTDLAPGDFTLRIGGYVFER